MTGKKGVPGISPSGERLIRFLVASSLTETGGMAALLPIDRVVVRKFRLAAGLRVTFGAVVLSASSVAAPGGARSSRRTDQDRYKNAAATINLCHLGFSFV
jgi:hypothetical protein